MLLQKRTNFEQRRPVPGHGDRLRDRDPLFERDWEVFVVKRDPETGEFVTATVGLEEAENIS